MWAGPNPWNTACSRGRLPAQAGRQQVLVGALLDQRIVHEPAEIEPAGAVAAGLDVAELTQGVGQICRALLPFGEATYSHGGLPTRHVVFTFFCT
jgi:hypothetical protein